MSQSPRIRREIDLFQADWRSRPRFAGVCCIQQDQIDGQLRAVSCHAVGVATSFQFRVLSRVTERLLWSEDPHRLTVYLDRLQQVRTVIQELQEGCWHALRLPSRQDVKQLRRRVQHARQQLKALEKEVERLSTLCSDQES